VSGVFPGHRARGYKPAQSRGFEKPEDVLLSETFTIAFIGFGEVSQRFSRDLLGKPGLQIKTYDILFDDARKGAVLVERARALGVGPSVSAAEAMHGADVVISAVTADAAETVAERAAPVIRQGQIFFDINSAAPETKQRSSVPVTAGGGDYVEGAVMAPVLEPGIRVAILAGGPASRHAAGLLNGFGMNIESVAVEYGKASAIKLCRSIMIKGIEALIVDCSKACSVWDVSGPVYASLSSTFPSIDWARLAATMTERVEVHGVRRAAEMRECAAMLAAAGLDPSLALAVAEAQNRRAR
jgi:hypothetical protein